MHKDRKTTQTATLWVFTIHHNNNIYKVEFKVYKYRITQPDMNPINETKALEDKCPLSTEIEQ